MNRHRFERHEPDPQKQIDKQDIEYINNHWKRLSELYKLRGDDINT